MQHRVERDDLIDRVGRTSLLPVAKSRIGDEKFRRRIGRFDCVIELDFRHRIVRKHLAKQIWLADLSHLTMAPDKSLHVAGLIHVPRLLNSGS